MQYNRTNNSQWGTFGKTRSSVTPHNLQLSSGRQKKRNWLNISRKEITNRKWYLILLHILRVPGREPTSHVQLHSECSESMMLGQVWTRAVVERAFFLNTDPIGVRQWNQGTVLLDAYCAVVHCTGCSQNNRDIQEWPRVVVCCYLSRYFFPLQN